MNIQDPIPAGALLVDLRDREDYEAGHLPGARHMTVDEIRQEAEEDTRILLYCYHGIRSLKAALFLKAAGYPNAESLGGISGYHGPLMK